MVKRKLKLKKPKIHLFTVFVFLLDLCVIAAFVVIYSPWFKFKEFWIPTAMTTMSHRYLAYTLYDEKTVDKVMSENYTKGVEEEVKLDDIVIDTNSGNKHYTSKYEKEMFTKDPDNDVYKIIRLEEDNFKGYLTVIYDPADVDLAIPKKLGKAGQSVAKLCVENDGLVGINGGGFEDPNFNSNGANPLGITISDGKVITDKDGNPLTVKVYNKEYETNVHSMFTIGQIEVNQEMVDDVSKMPLSHNKYSSLHGGYDYDVCQKILDVWGTDSIQLSPNVLTPYNYSDYYDAVSGNVGTMSGLYGTELKMLEETVHGIGNSRESILGVSSEEELTNLIMYQHAYNASSRYINTINEMLETLINIGR